jgi:GWxTD domain-containing protein
MSKALVLGFAALCMGVLSVTGDYAQVEVVPACSQESPFFCADAASFLKGGSPLVEVYVEVCNDALQFIRTAEGYQAGGDVTVVVFDKSGNQVGGDTFRIRLKCARYEETTAVDSCTTPTMAFRAEAGDYVLSITLTDRDSRRKGLIEARISVPSMTGSPDLSDIAFILPLEDASGPRWPGFKPDVRRTFGDVLQGVRFYYEVYRAGMDSVTAAYRVLETGGAEVYRDTDRFAAGATGRFGRIPMDTLSNGQYQLEVALLDRTGAQLVKRSRTFEVSREDFYLGRNVEDAVALLTYIATSGFIDAFLKADMDERKRLWETFWREKDPTPATPRNEFYQQMLERFRYANEHFRAGLTEGWRTDRGRIYITDGPPDEVDSYSMEINRNPTEVWFYFDNGRRYVFVDETGFGDYVLVRVE